MKSASQIADLLGGGEAETNLCSHLMRMPQHTYGIEITCQEPNPADKATVRGFWWWVPLLNWEEDKTHVPSLELGLDSARWRKMEQRASHGPLNLPFLPRTVGVSDSHACVGAQVPQLPAWLPCTATPLRRGLLEDQLGGKTKWVFGPQQSSETTRSWTQKPDVGGRTH